MVFVRKVYLDNLDMHGHLQCAERQQQAAYLPLQKCSNRSKVKRERPHRTALMSTLPFSLLLALI